MHSTLKNIIHQLAALVLASKSQAGATTTKHHHNYSATTTSNATQRQRQQDNRNNTYYDDAATRHICRAHGKQCGGAEPGGDSNPPPPRAPARPGAPSSPPLCLSVTGDPQGLSLFPPPTPYTGLHSRSALQGYPLRFWAPRRSAPSASGSSGLYSHPASQISTHAAIAPLREVAQGVPEDPTGFSYPSVPPIHRPTMCFLFFNFFSTLESRERESYISKLSCSFGCPALSVRHLCGTTWRGTRYSIYYR